MDTLTHAIVGTVTGEKFSEGKGKWKVPLTGALLANFPDLDVVFGVFLSDLQLLTFHRGFSHSILFLSLMSFPVAFLLNRFFHYFKERSYLFSWSFVAVCFSSHLILDLFTSYGMILFWPFTMHPVSLNIISIVDPAFTLPLIAGLLLYYFRKKSTGYLNVAILVSSVYLVFTLGNKMYMNNHFESRLQNEIPEFIAYDTKPTLMNNILWRAMAETENHFHVSFYSHFDTQNQGWATYEKQHNIISAFKHLPEIKTLLRALEYKYIVEPESENSFFVQDMRFGKAVEWLPERSSNFVFSYHVHIDEAENVTVIRDRKQLSKEEDRPGFGELTDRIRGYK